MTPTTYGRDFAYCLKSHGGVRGFNASLWRFLLRCTLFCHSVATFLTSVSSYEGGCGFEVVFLFAILFQVNIPSSAREMKSLRRIELSCKTQAQHRSIPITPVAFIEDALVTIDLLSTVPTATVVVKDAEGKVVYSSTEWNVDKVNIDLTGEQKGKYTLEIQLPTKVFSGEFELEN